MVGRTEIAFCDEEVCEEEEDEEEEEDDDDEGEEHPDEEEHEEEEEEGWDDESVFEEETLSDVASFFGVEFENATRAIQNDANEISESVIGSVSIMA